MKLFRRILFWTHLVCGITAAAVILLMSATGVLLTYEKQMIAWYDEGFRLREVPPNTTPLPPSQLVARGEEARGAFPTGLSMDTDPAAPVTALYGRDPALFINPYSGEVLGEGQQEMRSFMSGTREWHRWLAASGDDRATGKAITGASNVIFLFLVLSGLYLWIPKVFAWKHLRPILWFRGGLSGKARDFNWHNAAGFWCAVPLAFIVFSAVFISYPWATATLIEWMDGPQPPVAAPSSTASQPSPLAAAPRVGMAPALDAGWNLAMRKTPGWRTISLQFPKTEAEPLSFVISQGTGGQPQYRGTLNIHRDSGEVLDWQPFESLSAGRRARLWFRFVHTGEYYGVFGQTIAGIASAGGILLVYSGLALSFRRFLSWRARRRKAEGSQQVLDRAA